MSKERRVTGVKKAIGEFKKGDTGALFYNIAQWRVYYEALPPGTTRVALGPHVILLGYRAGNRETGESMDSLKAKVTAHYLAKEELGLGNYHYADGLSVTSPNLSADPRVVAYKKYLDILMTNIV